MGQEMWRTSPRSWREGERYFIKGVAERYLRGRREVRSRLDGSQDLVVLASHWDAWPVGHTLMVTCTTTGNLRDRFVKCPRQTRQTSMYNRYGPWRCHDSAPQIRPY